MAKSKRIYELARELGICTGELLYKCKAEGVKSLKPTSGVSAGLAATIIEWFTDVGDSAIEVTEKMGPLGRAARREAAEAKQRAKLIASCRDNPLLLAASRGDREELNTALRAADDLQIQTTDGRTALHLAAACDAAEAVDLLIDAGLSVDSTAYWGERPLDVAFRNGALHSARRLIARGADIHSFDRSHWTPLHHAVAARKLESVQFLLEAGADVNAKERYGDTPLHLSMYDVSIAAVLLEHGADQFIQGGLELPVMSYWNQLESDSRYGPVRSPCPDVRKLLRRHARQSPPDLGPMQARSLGELARLVAEHWVDIDPAARQYLDAWASCEDLQDKYGADNASELIARFLACAGAWQGPAAREVKKELRRRLSGRKRNG